MICKINIVSVLDIVVRWYLLVIFDTYVTRNPSVKSELHIYVNVGCLFINYGFEFNNNISFIIFSYKGKV